jgi:hypothetical protein
LELEQDWSSQQALDISYGKAGRGEEDLIIPQRKDVVDVVITLPIKCGLNVLKY